MFRPEMWDQIIVTGAKTCLDQKLGPTSTNPRKNTFKQEIWGQIIGKLAKTRLGQKTGAR